MQTVVLPGLGRIREELKSDLIELKAGGEGQWQVGRDGVQAVLTPLDRKVEFIVFADKTLAYIKSAMGFPAMYPLQEARFDPPAEAVLMDLDGTSVHSEAFWIWVIERTTARLLHNEDFRLTPEDEPHVSGHSVSEHIQHSISTY